jgi:TonB family protein
VKSGTNSGFLLVFVVRSEHNFCLIFIRPHRHAMLETKPIPHNNRVLNVTRTPVANARKQQHLMAAALILLLVTLVAILYRERDFWFPDERKMQVQEQEQQQAQPQDSSPMAVATAVPPKQTSEKLQSKTTQSKSKSKSGSPMVAHSEVQEDAPPGVTTTRTVLPPLEVEVIAGDKHHKLRPPSNTVQVDLERGLPSRATPSIAADPVPTAAKVTSAASERVEISSDAARLVTHSVTPAYPTLARQMRVQGSVILQAVIGRDGQIQALQVVSGPPILAGAAREAVKQWHFKPHLLGAEPVETQAKITVNFTISTN